MPEAVTAWWQCHSCSAWGSDALVTPRCPWCQCHVCKSTVLMPTAATPRLQCHGIGAALTAAMPAGAVLTVAALQQCCSQLQHHSNDTHYCNVHSCNAHGCSTTAAMPTTAMPTAAMPTVAAPWLQCPRLQSPQLQCPRLQHHGSESPQQQHQAVMPTTAMTAAVPWLQSPRLQCPRLQHHGSDATAAMPAATAPRQQCSLLQHRINNAHSCNTKAVISNYCSAHCCSTTAVMPPVARPPCCSVQSAMPAAALPQHGAHGGDAHADATQGEGSRVPPAPAPSHLCLIDTPRIPWS